ncbi:MAG TPA: CARDB domain-containing protein, partial [archaeon]|nr:CARDB domain-containing protein [archaeon]
SDNAISFSNGTPALSESITISVGVTNTDASYDANDVNVSFYKNSISAANRIGDQIIQIGESSVATASVNWVVDTEGTVPVHVQVDPNNVSGDDVTTDNTAVKNLTVSGSGCSPPASSTWTITNANIDCNNKTFDINGDIIVGTGGNLEFRDANVRMAYNEFGNNKSSFILNARSDGVLDLNNIVLSGVGAAIDLNIDYNETSTGSIISVNISSGTNLRTRKLFARNTASLFLSGTDVNEAFMANNADFNCYNDSSPCTFRGRFTVIGPDANAKLRGFMQFNGMTAEDFNVSGDSNLKRYYPIRALTPLEAVVSGADVNVRREDTNTVLAYFNTSTTSDGLALAGADFNNDENRTYTIIVRKQGQAFFLPLSLTTPSVFFQSSDASSSTLTGVALLRNVVDPILFTLQSDASRPIANAGDDQTVPTGGNDANVSLNPSRSYDPDNDTGATRGIC